MTTEVMVRAEAELERAVALALRCPHGEERAAVLREAWDWQGTPWGDQQCRKGSAVDCGRFLAGVWIGSGQLQGPIDYPHHPHDHYRHSQVEVFRDFLERYTIRLGLVPWMPADVIGFKVPEIGPSVCHAGIATGPDQFIHAKGGVSLMGLHANGEVQLEDFLGPYPKMWSGVWRFKSWCDSPS